MNLNNLHSIIGLLILPIFLSGGFLLFRVFKKQTEFDKSKFNKLRNYKPFKYQNIIKIILLSLSFLFVTISVLRPMWGYKIVRSEAKGIDMVFTLDVSKSMKALDLNNGKGELDRLSMAKNMIAQFVTENPENRYGLVIFAGTAFVSTPLTLDHTAFLTFLGGVDYDDVSKQGTDLGEALKASIDRFYNEQDKERGRSIVLISDGGEDIEGDIDGFSDVAKELGIKVFAVGVGSKKGVSIPEGKDVFGRISYKTFNGEVVKTKLNEKPLKEIAEKTNGQYFHAEKVGDLEKISDDIKNLQATVLNKEEVGNKEDQYQIFLTIGFILFVLFALLNQLKDLENIKEKLNKLSKKYLRIFTIGLMFLSLNGCAMSETSFRYHNAQGNKKFAKQYFSEAKDEYKLAGDASIKYKYISDNNLSIIDYDSEEFENAKNKLEESIYISCAENPKEFCDQLYYNLANVYYRIGEQQAGDEKVNSWNTAIENYKKTLEINSNDTEAEENIEFIMNKLQEEQEQSEENQNSQNGENDDEQNEEQKGDKEENSEESEQQNPEGSENSEEGNTGNQGETDQENSQKESSEGEGGNSAQAGEAGLDEETDKQVEEYLKMLEKQEAQNQKYFQQNPDAEQNSSDPFDDFFNDPFFDNFFGDSRSNNFNNNSDSNEIDW